MRQEFIAPTFLPTITESFLRDDFFFSGYLNRAMAKTSEKAFKITISSLVTLIFCSIAWFSLLHTTQEFQIYFMLFIPFIMLIILQILLNKMINIYGLLVHIVDDPYEISFA